MHGVRPAAGRPGVLIIGGATASGKSDLALTLAKRYDAEIVGADSRQVYRDMPIGTAAPSAEQQAAVPHHLIGFVAPDERYSAARYVADAAHALAAIQARGKRAIVVGGTGFYLRALCGDVDLAAQPNPAVRARMQREAQIHPLDVLQDWLRALDPARAAAVNANDAYRVTRALEVHLTATSAAGTPVSAAVFPTLRAGGVAYAKIALRVEAAELARRIAERTDAMLAAGFVAEAERIGAAAVAADAVGYRDAIAFVRGWLTWNELRTRLARMTRRYAKRQLTWFRAEPGLTWIDSGDDDAAEHVAAELGWR